MTAGLTPIQGLVAFMATLAGPEPSGFIELRHRRPGSWMRPRFFDAREPNAAATAATVLCQSGEVYVGCAPRRERAGDKHAVAQGWVLWVDCDDPESSARLLRFEPQPAIVIRTSQRGRHAYWPLERPLPAAELERANRRLAHALSACQSAVTNAAAVLRPPATLNWKYDPPEPVSLERYTGERFAADQVAGQLEDPPSAQRRRRSPGESSSARAADPLLAIEPPTYVEALTGRRVGRDGKVACPFHPDRTPSLHAYPEPAQGWACFSAQCWQGDRPNGGDIYDLAGQLLGLSTRGRDFPELRRRLCTLFLPSHEPPAPRHRTATPTRRAGSHVA
jgi:hypothetical protein